jgi:phage FluMu protein Com/dienelactone hydrolase
MNSDAKNIRCGQCNQLLRIPASVVGKKVRCPNCQNIMTVVASKESVMELSPHPEDEFEDEPDDIFSAAYPSDFDFDAGLPSLPASRMRLGKQPSQGQAYSYAPSGYRREAQREAFSKNLLRVLFGGLILSIVGVVIVVLWVGFQAGRDLVVSLTKHVQESNATGDADVSSTERNTGIGANDVATIAPSTMSDRSAVSELTAPQSTLRFPDLPAPRTMQGNDALIYETTVVGYSKKPMRIRVYAPKGELAASSTPCVIVAPAGTPLLHGVDIGDSDNMEEILPFIKAGMFVAVYQIDGHVTQTDRPPDEKFLQEMRRGFEEFVKADSGVSNGKTTIDFLFAKFPSIDRSRVYSSGHSSAATLSLLMAAKDHRITKCIAFAPITDLAPRIGDIQSDPTARKYFPGFPAYLTSGSPSTYMQTFRCPLFIMHARDDDNEPFASTNTFVAKLRSTGASVTFLEVPAGGHYAPMVSVGLPKAVEWLNQ